MTKYISSKGACRVNNYHEDKDCYVLKSGTQEASQGVIDYHDLKPCKYCSNEELTRVADQNWEYQRI